MQQGSPAKDVLLLIHDVGAPKSEHDLKSHSLKSWGTSSETLPNDLSLELADDDIAMHPVTGCFTSHPKHESAFSAQIFRLAFPIHVLLMAGMTVLHVFMVFTSPSPVRLFWVLAAIGSACTLLTRVLVHLMYDVEYAQRIGSWVWAVLMSQDCVIAITGYVISPHQDACGVSRPNYVPMAVVTMLSALVLALANGTHGMSFGHKSALVGLLLASAFVMVGVCGKDELVLMLCEIAALVIGYAVAHMAEFFVRLSYAEKVMETRRVSKEKRLLEVRNQQLTAEKERLLYDVQRPGRPLADDDRSAIGRGLRAKTGQPYPATASDADGSEPSELAPPSFPPGPPSSSSTHSMPLSWAEYYTEAERQQWLAARSVTDQKVAPPFAEIGRELSASSACASSAEITAAPATKRKATHLVKLHAGKPRCKPASRRLVTKATLTHNYRLKVAPLTWAEADRQHRAAMTAQLVTDRKVYAVLADHLEGNARAARTTEVVDGGFWSHAKTGTISTQAHAAAVALAAMANGSPGQRWRTTRAHV